MKSSIQEFREECRDLDVGQCLLAARQELRSLDSLLPQMPKSLHRYHRQVKGLIDFLATLQPPNYLPLDEWYELKPFAEKANEAGAGLNIDELFV